MYVRGAKNRDEVWLLDQIERLDLDETAFRSRDYVIAIDEETGDRAGFGRLRIHTADDGEEYGELTSIGVIEAWRNQGVGAHIIERLVELARDEDFEEVFALIGEPGYLEQFGFEPIDPSALPDKLLDRLRHKREGIEPDAVPVRLELDSFRMPPQLRDRFKAASPSDPQEEDDDGEPAEDFGIDPDTATYKYDTGGGLD